MVSRQRFDSFGLRTATGPLLQRYGFTGREHDAESGLIYFRARAYDPAVGTFLQRDPIGFSSGDLNLYAYTWDDPYNWKDPSGLSATADYAVTAGAGIGFGGLWGVLRRLTFLIAKDLILNSTHDNTDNPPDNPPAPDTDNPKSDCDLEIDPNCDGDEEPYDWTPHAEDAMMDENISPDDIYNAIEHPINTRPGDNNTTIFDGTHVSVAVDTQSLWTPRPRIVTVWR